MAKVLVVDDNPFIRLRTSDYLKRDLGCEVFVAASGPEALEIIKKHSPDLMILDLALPNMPGTEIFYHAMKLKPDMDVVVITAFGTNKIALDMGREGVREFIEKDRDFLKTVVEAVRRLLVQAARRPKVARRLPVDPPPTLWMEGDSAAIKKILESIDEVAPTDAAVIIEGEEGTCKVDVAHFIHNKSRHSRRSFIVINCRFFPSAHADHLFYGYTKECLEDGGEGSDGYFKRAEGGTLLLHHIEDLVPEVQQKLLRILRDKVYYRLGDKREFKLNTRIMATTGTDLPGLLKDGLIMEELMQVLGPVTITVPPLRERVEDIPVMADKCRADAIERHGWDVMSISTKAIRKLQLHDWPQNIGELFSVIDTAIERCKDQCLAPDDISLQPLTVEPNGAQSTTHKDMIEEIERKRMKRALIANHWKVADAAMDIGMSRSTFYDKMGKYGLKEGG